MIGNIKEHMDVIASDGNRIGRVDHVKGEQIELAKMDLETGFKHRMIPVSWVDHVDEHVHLNLTEDQGQGHLERQAVGFESRTKEAPAVTPGPLPFRSPRRRHPEGRKASDRAGLGSCG